jgi:tetratricopeptide (TPR) repeat protein
MQQQKTSAKENFMQKLSTAIYNLRYILISILAVFVIVVITWAVIAKVTGDRIETSTILVEKAEELFNNWVDEEDEEAASNAAEDLIISLDRILEDYPKLYASQRALYIKGSFHFRSENWEQAGETFLDLANRFSDSYLAPIAGINAAASYEEAENFQEAISAYTMIIEDFIDVSPEIPRVFFALGRLAESAGDDNEKALEYYNQLVENYPSSSWTNLARDRIIYLKID